MDNQICALSERVARLEKSNRAMKVIVAVTVLAMTAMTSTPQLLAKSVTKMFALDADTITVQRINLVNSTGQIVAVLGTSGNGAGLTALDGNSNTVLVSGVSADGTSAGAVVMDSNGYSRAGFGNASNGSGFFAGDANNVTRYAAGVGPSGSQAGTVTYDATGKPQLELGGTGDGSANGMVSLDSTGQDRFDAGYSTANGGGALVKDASGNIIWFAPPGP
jgi:hypothetical protein